MNFFVNILGSGAALPTGRRRCSAQVVNINGFKCLIDCGEGTQDRVRQMRVKLQSISTIVISHLHGDHFFGLPGLLSTMHLCGRTEPVAIVAPTGARQAIETLFELTGNHVTFPIDWTEMDFSEGVCRVVDNEFCTIDAFPLVHTVPTYGFRIAEKPRGNGAARVYTYCCDTAYEPALVPLLQGSDLLCLECTFADQMAPLATDRQHLTAGLAGRLAAQASARNLLLSHISARYRETDVLLAQAQAEFPQCIIAADGMRIGLMAGGKLNINN